MTKVTLRYFDGCPNWEVADRRLRRLEHELGFSISYERVETPEEADRLGFAGSPTVLVNGVDPFVTGDEPTGLACRVHVTPDGPQGAPTLEQLRDVLTSTGASQPNGTTIDGHVVGGGLSVGSCSTNLVSRSRGWGSRSGR